MFDDEGTKIFYRCTQCSYVTHWQFSLGQHVKLYHSVSNSFNPSNDVEEFHCDLCPFETRFKLDLLNHNKRECADGRGGWRPTLATCSHCNFRTASRLIRLVHSSGYWRCTEANLKWRVTKQMYGQFSCPICSYCGASRDRMKAHYINKHAPAYLEASNGPIKHHLFLRFKCERCPFKSKTESSLKRHMQTHVPPEAVKRFNSSNCSTQQSSQGSQNIIIETGNHPDQLNTRHTINIIVNNNKKERQKRYRERNRDTLKQREAERRKRIQSSQSIAGPSTSLNTTTIELNNEEMTLTQRNEQGTEINALQNKRDRQQRYREKNRDKLKQREAERRRRLQNAECIKCK